MKDIKSTPASRWAKKYKKRYWNNLGIVMIFIGIPFLIIPPLGIGIIAIGIYMIYKNNKYWKKK